MQFKYYSVNCFLFLSYLLLGYHIAVQCRSTLIENAADR